MKLRNKKTGEIITLKDEGELALLKLIENSLPNGLSLWEKVKEPLIKDEKIRKAVRAWAEACGLSYVVYKQASNEYYDPDTRGAFAIKFKVIPVEIYLEDGECYTIAELCGEGEE